jgi:Protein of unknown function (DUF3006)
VASEKIAHSRWVVDSIEESMASIEVDGETMVTVPLAMLPEAARQGHVLRVTIEVDTTGTKKALDESAAQVNKGAARQANDPGGDIAL